MTISKLRLGVRVHPNLFFSAGASSIQAIIDQATEDRTQLKGRWSPKLRQGQNTFVSNRFLAVVKFTLKKRYPVLLLHLWRLALVRSLWTQFILSDESGLNRTCSTDYVPNGADLERFLVSIVCKSSQ
jgi:hypothetical protein